MTLPDGGAHHDVEHAGLVLEVDEDDAARGGWPLLVVMTSPTTLVSPGMSRTDSLAAPPPATSGPPGHGRSGAVRRFRWPNRSAMVSSTAVIAGSSGGRAPGAVPGRWPGLTEASAPAATVRRGGPGRNSRTPRPWPAPPTGPRPAPAPAVPDPRSEV